MLCKLEEIILCLYADNHPAFGDEEFCGVYYLFGIKILCHGRWGEENLFKAYRQSGYVKNYYKVLGLKYTATDAEVKQAYHRLCRQYHPDVNPRGEEKFKEINEVYHFLSDKQKRKTLDALLQENRVDYYAVLGLRTSANDIDIRFAYIQKKLEADLAELMAYTSRQKMAAFDRRVVVEEAFKTLGNPQKRKEYDTLRKSLDDIV
ncbi:DnaJ domain-containing protein [Candidatus Woesearchaeota archaeon]|nr:DnaJ domain-containing protein [Candidatus Woesearchaeota archaeon]